MPMTTVALPEPVSLNPDYDWFRVAKLVLISRTMDLIEETELYPKKLIPYQFSARGHELAQVLLGSLLTHRHDGVGAYYRSRPLLLTLGLSLEDAMAAPLAKSGGFSDGRDIGVVCNLPSRGAPTVLPMGGDVGSQYTPTAGWAQAILYHANVLKDDSYAEAIAVVLGGEGSVATNGFWSSLMIATTLRLPMLFYVEDNGYALSVPSEKQTPGGNIAKNLSSFTNLKVFQCDGTAPSETASLLKESVDHVRARKGPALIRLTVPRLSGHSAQDTQAYKSPALLAEEKARDPLYRLYKHLVPALFTETEWQELETTAQRTVKKALAAALNRPEPNPEGVRRYLFCESNEDGSLDVQIQGGLAPSGHRFAEPSSTPEPAPARTTMLEAIRRTLECELRGNLKVLVFGEDVGLKGGVHAATMGLQKSFGEERVFDTSLSEEGIIGRAVGMALAGLMPVTEIQFRKYADPATEQLNNCGTLRWRTANRFAAPIVVRIPGGFHKCGDPWHSVSGEVTWLHGLGWQVAYPSNAEDAAGLLRSALRSNNPTIFFEHRALLDGSWARRPYPGDSYVVPFGKARTVQDGDAITIVTWGAMVERSEQAARDAGVSADIIDLRTLSPWDRDAVLTSVEKTRRCLIVHEDTLTAGFGAEIAAFVSKDAFLSLDAPVERIATPDVPLPYNVGLMNAVLPGVPLIREKILEMVQF
jgi:2-oxoisovalerate dehydrogenase E1 component